MLEAHQHIYPELDIDTAVTTILWREARRYRVSITIDDDDVAPDARAALFKNFDVKAPGDVKRRRVETIHIPELRRWMEAFAQRTIGLLATVPVHVCSDYRGTDRFRPTP